jgi:hypothetical protein
MDGMDGWMTLLAWWPEGHGNVMQMRDACDSKAEKSQKSMSNQWMRNGGPSRMQSAGF